MQSGINNTLLRLWERPATGKANTEADANPYLEVNVIFTTSRPTRAALKTADELARHLTARIRFLVPQLVPLPFPVTSPPVSVTFAMQRFCDMAKTCREAVEVSVQVYFCRDKRQVLREVLKPQSLVVLGGRKRWWVTPEQKLARDLRTNGHRVVFVDRD